MATVTVAHHPELTVDDAMEVFRRHFAGMYDVYKTMFLNRDFVVKQSAWTGVGVKLQQEPNATTFVFTALMPSMIAQLLFGGLIVFLFLRSSWKAMENEVREFIENASEFN